MLVSNLYTARVPVVTGEVMLYLEALREVLLTLRNDDFFSAMVTEVDVNTDGTFDIILRRKGYYLSLGQSTNLTKKLRNFKAFYKSMQVEKRHKEYKKIDLRFNNQVVATE